MSAQHRPGRPASVRDVPPPIRPSFFSSGRPDGPARARSTSGGRSSTAAGFCGLLSTGCKPTGRGHEDSDSLDSMCRCPHVRLGLCIWLLVISPVIAVAPAAHGATAKWMWPLDPKPVVLRSFQLPPEPWSAGHRGVDLSARFGQQIRSSGAGVVTFAGLVAGLPVVTVSHGVLRTTYEPVEPAVLRGDRVRPGDVIGRLSRAGAHCGERRPCLHWGLLRGSTYLDPLALLRSGPIRLLPRNASPPGALSGAAAGTRDPTAANHASRDRLSPFSIQEPDRGLSRGQAAIVGGSALALGALAVAAHRRRLEPGDSATGSGH